MKQLSNGVLLVRELNWRWSLRMMVTNMLLHVVSIWILEREQGLTVEESDFWVMDAPSGTTAAG